MAQAVTDFLRNAGLLDLLNMLIAAIFVVIGLASFVSRRPMHLYKLMGLAMVPLLLGLVTMYVDYTTSGIGMFGTPSEAAIAARRQAALINGVIGALGALVFVALGMLGRKSRIGNGE